MRIFNERAFPLDSQPLIRLAWSDDEELSWAAGLALRNIRHPLVRQTALHFLANPTRIYESVRLLAPNYEPGDHILIKQALAAPQNTEAQVVGYHHMGDDALNLFKIDLKPEFAVSLVTLYERGPCSGCRARCFDQLRALNLLPAWVIEECKYDANPKLREKALSLSVSMNHSRRDEQ